MAKLKRFEKTMVDLANVLRQVSPKYASAKGMKQIKTLNYPVSADLMGKDPVRARRAARELYRSYSVLKAQG